ncbi:MAG: hypothetical protein ABI690_26845 [Chloroflexota bacterium]
MRRGVSFFNPQHNTADRAVNHALTLPVVALKMGAGHHTELAQLLKFSLVTRVAAAPASKSRRRFTTRKPEVSYLCSKLYGGAILSGKGKLSK